MPLLKRLVSPTHVSRVPLVEEWVRDESGNEFTALVPATNQPQDLEAFTNLTLANLITQLSSLSRHAEDLFGEMITESTAILNRTVSLQGRVDKLAVKVKNLDSNVEEVSLQDIHMRKAFKSSNVFDQQVVSRQTLSTPMLETYHMCEQPPPLQELNPYRDDGKDGLKFYTDPAYFFNLWCEEMVQETERLKHDKKQKHAHAGDQRNEPSKPKGESRPKKHKVRQAGNSREISKQLAISRGEYISSPQSHHYGSPAVQSVYDHTTSDGKPVRPNSIEIQSRHVNGQHEVGYNGSGAYSPPRADMTQAGYAGYPQAYQEPYSGYPPYSPDGSQGGTPNRTSTQRGTPNRPSQPPPLPPSGENTPTPPGGSHSGTPTRRGASQGRDSLPPPPLPPGSSLENHMSPLHLGGPPHHHTPSHRHHEYDHELPPPPPIPADKSEQDPPPPSPPPPPLSFQSTGGIAPLPPSPPPPPMTNGNGLVAPAPPPMPNGTIASQVQNVILKKTDKPQRPIEKDTRTELLRAIREGTKLRKVDEVKVRPREGTEELDVASILQRRFAFEQSDSESESESDSADSDEWDETSA